MYHQTAGDGEGVLIQRSRGDAGEGRSARQLGEFVLRDADRGDSRLSIGCVVSRVTAGSAEPYDHHRSANPCQRYPGGHHRPQAAGPELPGGSSAIAIADRATRDAQEPADAQEPVAREPPAVRAQRFSPSREGSSSPASVPERPRPRTSGSGPGSAGPASWSAGRLASARRLGSASWSAG